MTGAEAITARRPRPAADDRLRPAIAAGPGAPLRGDTSQRLGGFGSHPASRGQMVRA